jgi:subfamily B ATP-binding cassette protein MsbA
MWGLAKPYRVRLILGVVTGIVGGLIEPLIIATIAFVYGVVFPEANAEPITRSAGGALGFIQEWGARVQQSMVTGVRAHPWAVAGLVAVIPAVVTLRGLFTYLNIYFLEWAAVRTIADLRVKLFRHISYLSADFYNRNSTGQLMSRTMNDTGALQHVISHSVGTMVKDPATVVALSVYLLTQQPKLTLISMIVMPLCMVPVLVYSRKVRNSSRAMQNNSAELSSVLTEAITGNRVVKAYGLEDVMVDQFQSKVKTFINHYMKIVRSKEAPGPLLETVGAMGVALVLVYLMTGSGQNRPTSRDFLILVASLFAVYKPLKNLTKLHISLNQARAASERVFQLLATSNSIPEPAKPVKLTARNSPVEFDSICFSYGDKRVLHDINLTVEPGQVAALVGPSGSGKTTLVNLLLRFHDPESGAIRIGGTDIRNAASADLRNQIAVVSQETVLFNQTLYRNIQLGRLDATREEIMEAARLAHALDFINEKPRGFDTIVGEKGVTLSGGQRQRIAIARAILKNAPILILDEATNALDSESERLVQEALDTLMEGRTAICIAHRLSTIQNADMIVVLEKGRILEQGTHAELLRSQGLYSKLSSLNAL